MSIELAVFPTKTLLKPVPSLILDLVSAEQSQMLQRGWRAKHILFFTKEGKGN